VLCKITIADRDYLQNNYFSILPDGNVRVVDDDQDKIVGSLLQDSVQALWQSPLFDREKHFKCRTWLRLE
jgi:hypothetical protein